MAVTSRWAGHGYSGHDDWEWDREGRDTWEAWEPDTGSWSRPTWSVRVLPPRERRGPPGLSGKGEGKTLKGSKGKSAGKMEVVKVYDDWTDWNGDCAPDWSAQWVSASKGKDLKNAKGSKDGKSGKSKGSKGVKGKEGSGVAFDNGWGGKGGKEKGKEGREGREGKGKRSKANIGNEKEGWPLQAPNAKPSLGPVGSAHPSEPVWWQGAGSPVSVPVKSIPVGARPQDYKISQTQKAAEMKGKKING